MSIVYDVIILGAGPAGLSAGLYAGRSRLSTLIIEKGGIGGQIILTDNIENYPGQNIEGESGASLTKKMKDQVELFGTKLVNDEIIDVVLENDIKVLRSKTKEYHAKNFIIATGSKPRLIACKREMEFVGKGVSYCATCDGNFFEDLEVFVVGGGDAALEEAMYLTRFAKKVTIIHRRNELRATKCIQEKVFANKKIDFIWDTVVEEIGGDEVLSEITLKNVKTKERNVIRADSNDGMFGLFGFVGTEPNSSLFKGLIEMDEQGYIKTDENMRTNVMGVYAVGDVRVKKYRQVVTAVADGAIAAMEIK